MEHKGKQAADYINGDSYGEVNCNNGR